MQKEIIKPLERPQDLPINKMSNTQKEKWAMRTDKQAPAENLLPFLQPFKEYYFPKSRTDEQIQNYQSKFLDTDNIAIRAYSKEDKTGNIQPKTRFYNKSTTINIVKQLHHLENNPKLWEIPSGLKTVNNRSGVSYDILNHKENPICGAIPINILDKKVVNKKKGVGEFEEFTRLYYPNFNSNFEKAYNENQDLFKRYRGIFSTMYDRAHKNGNIVVPFRKGGFEKVEPGDLATRFTMRNVKRRSDIANRVENYHKHK